MCVRVRARACVRACAYASVVPSSTCRMKHHIVFHKTIWVGVGAWINSYHSMCHVHVSANAGCDIQRVNCKAGLAALAAMHTTQVLHHPVPAQVSNAAAAHTPEPSSLSIAPDLRQDAHTEPERSGHATVDG